MGDFVLLLFMAFFMAMFRLLGRWRRITLFTMCKRLTDFRAPHNHSSSSTEARQPSPHTNDFFIVQRLATLKQERLGIHPLFLVHSRVGGSSRAFPNELSNTIINSNWAVARANRVAFLKKVSVASIFTIENSIRSKRKSEFQPFYSFLKRFTPNQIES